jgi:hypothetical protein
MCTVDAILCRALHYSLGNIVQFVVRLSFNLEPGQEWLCLPVNFM